MAPPFVDGEQLRTLLPFGAAVDALEQAYGAELPHGPPRAHLPATSGDLLVMPAAGKAGAGVKLVTVAPGNPGRGLPLIQGVYVLFAPDTLTPVAIVDGAAVTAVRTPAVSALATRYLATADARHLVLFGAGTQAAGHLEAMLAVRPLDTVTVVSRSAEPARRLVARARELGLAAGLGDADAVADADLVCTCTTSSGPVLDGGLLRPGTHINAVGSYRPEARELDDETLRRGRLVVDDRDGAFAETGDLLIPLAAGVISRDTVLADLAGVVAGAKVRRTADDITVFKSVGVAAQDLVVVCAAFERLAHD